MILVLARDSSLDVVVKHFHHGGLAFRLADLFSRYLVSGFGKVRSQQVIFVEPLLEGVCH